jgi:hypothetical protein
MGGKASRRPEVMGPLNTPVRAYPADQLRSCRRGSARQTDRNGARLDDDIAAALQCLQKSRDLAMNELINDASYVAG